MYIGKLAQLCAVSTKTIRHYELIGLLPPASRRGSYRVYHERDIERLSLIRQAQQLGFSLAEIKQAIVHPEPVTGHNTEQGIGWQVITLLLRNKLQSLDQQIAQLQQKRLQVQQQQSAIEACLSADPACQPPLF